MSSVGFIWKDEGQSLLQGASVCSFSAFSPFRLGDNLERQIQSATISGECFLTAPEENCSFIFVNENICALIIITTARKLLIIGSCLLGLVDPH